MADIPEAQMGVNSWLEEELYRQYLRDHGAVDESWRRRFEQAPPKPRQPVKPAAAAPASAPAAAPAPGAGEEIAPLRGAAARLAVNMAASLTIPIATSQRAVPVKVMDENRRIINQHRTLLGKSKVSFTHLLGWAIVKALGDFPNLNNAYAEGPEGPARLTRPQVNLGIAVDVAGRDGARNLLVPNIKNAGAMDFQKFLAAFDDVVARTRANRLTPADFQGTTISLTNPGTVGTAASNPRLMPGTGRHYRGWCHRLSGRVPGRRPGDPRRARHEQGHDADLHLRPTASSRGRNPACSWGACTPCWTAMPAFYEEIFSSLRMPHQPVQMGDGPQLAASRRRRPHRRDCQGSRHYPAHQHVPRARPPDRGPGPARLRTRPASRTRSGDLRPDHLGPRPRVPTPARWAKPWAARAARVRSPRCVKSWRHCARPTAAKSAAST